MNTETAVLDGPVGLEQRIRTLEATVGVLMRVIGEKMGGAPTTTPKLLSQLTVKQHVALQMIMAGKSNADIAERFGVTENGAKVYVRAIAKKWGVHTRSQIIMAVYDEWEAIPEHQYEALTGGVPKDWAKRWLDEDRRKDPWLAVYAVDA